MRVHSSPCIGSVLHQEAHHRVIAPQNCMAQSGTVHEFRPLFQHRAKLGDVAIPGGFLEPLDRDTVHEGFQFRPTVEAVRTREDELGIMQCKRERLGSW